MEKVRCLVIDANPLVRNCLQELLATHPNMVVQGSASGLGLARQKIRRDPPDVVVLGRAGPADERLAFLRALMRALPTPVVMLVEADAAATAYAAEAVALGAVDVIEQSAQHPETGLRARARTVADRVFRAAFARVSRLQDAEGPVGTGGAQHLRAGLVALGASTGGVESLGRVIAGLSPQLPPVVIAQHIPDGFSELFARRLDRKVAVRVHVAEHGVRALPGHVYVAPGNAHLEVHRRSGAFWLRLSDAPPVNRHRPSVDVLFRSVAAAAGAGAVVGLLTGMGEDGAQGLAACRASGAYTFAQDEASSIVFGMPRAAIEIGAAMEVIALDDMAARIHALTHG